MKNLKVILLVAILFANNYSQPVWSWKYPLPQGNSINDSWIISENSIIAVGYPGLIIISNDNGQTWKEIHEVLGINKKLNSIFFLNELIGWVVGEKGIIIKTTDGGKNWKKIFIDDSTYKFNKIFFLNDSFGWIAADNYPGDFAVLFETKDGGNTWSKNNRVYGFEMKAVHFFTPDTGFTFGDQILKTEDGGESFSVIDPYLYGASTFNTVSVHIEEPNDIWVLGIEGNLFYSHDKGNTWQGREIIDPLLDSYNKIIDVHFFDEKIGYLVGQKNYNYYTIDGGNTWEQFTYSDSYSFTECLTLSKDFMLYFENNGKILKSYDSGYSLLNEDNFIPITFNSITFQDKENGYISGFDTKGQLNVVKISDSLFTWNINVIDSNLAPNYSNYSKITFSDITHGYLIDNYNIYKTIDAGSNWFNITKTIDNTIMDIWVIDSLKVLVSNNKGKIFKTVNGGESWNQIIVDENKIINNIEFINELIGFCCTSLGSIFKTIDGGLSWELKYEKSMAPFILPTKISFPSAEIVWGVSYYGDIIKTEDGGDSWFQVNQGESFDVISDIYSFNKDVFWISDHSGKNLVTFDGGINWTRPAIFQDKGIRSFSKISDSEFYAIGGLANIIKVNISNNIVQVQNDKIIKNEFHLNQNFPNPFNPTTTISYAIPKKGLVKIKIFDNLGRKIDELVNKQQLPGNYEVQFNAKSLPSGIYFYQLTFGDFSETKKLLFLK
ncbi:MAG: T9SS type A sorting domain-containing protein [Ignavibacteriae bacterium]|nr:T9SS type A sorting domain-containing protein [Ignavibacteriota bacterium]MCB9207347.1 T9SS type A sorting domain-containing protein [Ignavibacteriales bacterium]MCB9210423.1 T9SS type A sorting domain-containing protein [Ignavibacteriales bacterium]MCB9220110.1 T9SS type A sorting domain-containing protein [Ignavibacteriales bacterium]MCB9259810.1 T9SS type A sorting domain-containing protein [Ignavibacteriales bacterium]